MSCPGRLVSLVMILVGILLLFVGVGGTNPGSGGNAFDAIIGLVLFFAGGALSVIINEVEKQKKLEEDVLDIMRRNRGHP